MPGLRSMSLPKEFKGTGYVRVKRIAEFLCCDISVVYKWIKQEKSLKAVKKGRLVLVSKKDFRDFMDLKFKSA